MSRPGWPLPARWLYWSVGAAAHAVFALRARFAASEARERARERCGRWWPLSSKAPEDGRWIWLHAASVGEVLLANRLAAPLKAEGWALVLSCNTATGRAMAAAEIFDETHYFPVDWPPTLARILKRSRPRLLVVIETEIWPSLLQAMAERDVPVAFANARISERSWPRYQRLSALVGPLIDQAALVCARDSSSAARLKALGADDQRLTVTGDIKFDAISATEVSATLPALTSSGPFVLAASTHDPEEGVALEAFKVLRETRADLGLVIAPRHPDRSERVLAQARAAGWRTASWTESGGDGAWDVLVLDTVGELRRFFASAPPAFIGGSLVDVGGHNLLEPAAFSLRPIAGTQLEGVADQAAVLAGADALVRVSDAATLAEAWSRALDDPVAEEAAGRRAFAVLAEHSGALERSLAKLAPLLDGGCS